MSLTTWWQYGPNDDSIVESCSNSAVGNCISYCGDVTKVYVNITDDDISFADTGFNTTEHVDYISYCIAELPGHCAYDYWLVFKLVPLLLHVSRFLLQCVCWMYFKEFTPQEKQYHVVLAYLYPEMKEVKKDGCVKKDGEGRYAMILQLINPTFYSIFAFVEYNSNNNVIA